MARVNKADGFIVGALVLGALALIASSPSKPKLSQERVNELHRLMAGQLARVAQTLGIAAPVLQANYNVNNADASGNVIRYNPRWIDAKLREHCNDGECVLSIIVGVLAHEMSHILHGDRYTSSVQHNHNIELRADRVAGWVLAKLGHASGDMQKVWREFVAMNHPTHPPAPHRIQAIVNGYERATHGSHWA
jgi:hypothetical protein